MSLISGPESAASDQPVDSTLTYSCPFPSGTQQITARIVGAFPAAGTVGRPIQPSDVKLTATLPSAALADLTRLGAASVAASARLTITVAQSGTSTNVAWPGLTAPSTPIPGSGGLSLTASGAVPPATVTASGAAAFIAGPLRLVLTPRKADGTATSPDGTATSPDTLPLDCTLQLGSNMVLAAVPVGAPANSAPSSPGTGTGVAAPRTARQRAAADDPSCEFKIDLPPRSADGFLAGFSNVNKLNGAALIGRENGQTTGHAQLKLLHTFVVKFSPCTPPGISSETHILSSGSLAYGVNDPLSPGKPQLPPAKATFLTFGIMPTTATMELTQAPGTVIDIDVSESVPDVGDRKVVTILTSKLSIRIRDVRVNGVPLDVGPNCESVTPMAVTLFGNPPEYDLNTGGPLTGTATIPPFSGCGVGEDLDPLFTASVSGPGNFMKLIQGKLCVLDENGNPADGVGQCPAPRPEPQR
ncbi:hypothetical protein GCM10009780_59160 [Actinomadura alba]